MVFHKDDCVLIKIAAVGFIPIIVIALLFGVYLNYARPATTTNGEGYVTGNTTAYATNLTSGLELILSMNSSIYGPGQGILINISEYNTLSTANNISRANDFRIPNLTLGACGRSIFPFGVAVFKGYYNASDVSSADSLSLFPLGIPCDVPASIPWYLFQGLSDNASMVLSEKGFPIQFDLSIDGSWSGSSASGNSATFESFSPGIYTVAAGDEWGELVLLHFAVTPF